MCGEFLRMVKFVTTGQIWYKGATTSPYIVVNYVNLTSLTKITKLRALTNFGVRRGRDSTSDGEI